MGNRDHEPDRVTQGLETDQHEVNARGGGGPKDPARERPNAEAAKHSVDEIIQLHRDRVGELPTLVALLAQRDAWNFTTTIFPNMGSYTPGDTMLEIAMALDSPPGWTLDAALKATRKPSKAALHRYVTAIPRDDLAALQDDTFTALKAALDGKLADQLPMVLQNFESFRSHTGFVTWLVDTTPPGVVADMFVEVANAGLATTLDSLASEHAWDWVDHLPAAQGFPQLADFATAITKHTAEKQKITARLGPMAADEKAQARFRAAHTADVTTVLAGNPTLRDLVDAIARHGRVDDIDESYKIVKLLNDLGATADDVLAIAQLISVGGDVIVSALLASKGLTPQHLERYLMKDGGPGSIADPKLLKRVRAALPNLRAEDVFRATGETQHELLAQHPELAAWYLESASPHELLWFTAGGELAAKTCALYDKRDPAWKFVFELTATAPAKQLRLLALNCPNQKVAQHVRDNLLAEKPRAGERIDHATAPDENTSGGELGRLGDALAQHDPDLLARIADLKPAEAARVGDMDKFASQIAEQLPSGDFPRAAALLGLSFARTIKFARLPTPSLVAYLRTRPAAEEAEALQDTALVERAIDHVHPDLLIVFPSLTDPAKLAPILTHKLLKRLLEHSDPNQVAQLIARPPALAKTEAIFDEHSELIDRFPRYRHMTKGGRSAVDNLAKSAKGDTADTLGAVRTNDWDPKTDVREEGIKLHAADKLALDKGLEKLLADGGSAASVLALFREHRDQVAGVLSDISNRRLISQIARFINLPVTIVVPELSLSALLGMNAGRTWLFDYPDAYVLLDQLASNPAASSRVGALLGEGNADAVLWLERVPRGPALTDAETLALDRMQPHVVDHDVLSTLFQTRFATEPPPEYDVAMLAALYKTLTRLPRAHLQQGRIQHIVSGKPDEGKAGTWNGKDVMIGQSLHPNAPFDGDNAQNDAFHPETGRMTKNQLRALYGWDDVEIQQQIAQGNLEYLVASDQYQLVTKRIEKFAATVLHEVGHAVDDVLGEQTEPIYGGIAQWHSYAESDFELWAAEMGGWDRVSAEDKPRIAEVWRDALRDGSNVREMVGANHPAVAKQYADANVGIVIAARDGKSVDDGDPLVIGDRAFMRQGYYGRYYSLSAAAVATKPSGYSMFAPQEYFAECYVEYYRDVDGSPGSAAKKGGALPSATKQWFTKHVDGLQYDPKRFTERKA
jgi:hypothetical protein